MTSPQAAEGTPRRKALLAVHWMAEMQMRRSIATAQTTYAQLHRLEWWRAEVCERVEGEGGAAREEARARGRGAAHETAPSPR